MGRVPPCKRTHERIPQARSAFKRSDAKPRPVNLTPVNGIWSILSRVSVIRRSSQSFSHRPLFIGIATAFAVGHARARRLIMSRIRAAAVQRFCG
jgi:hypothetical protein